jgi:two-component system nitrogen regulation response regulator NtrX
LPEPSLATASGATVPNEAWTRLLAVKTLQDFQDEAEKLYIIAKLAENGGNVTRTAEAVETPRSNLYKKMDRYGLKKREEGTA